MNTSTTWFGFLTRGTRQTASPALAPAFAASIYDDSFRPGVKTGARRTRRLDGRESILASRRMAESA